MAIINTIVFASDVDSAVSIKQLMVIHLTILREHSLVMPKNIVACKIIFKKRQQCLCNAHYTSFGWWMRTQPRYMALTEKEQKRLRRKVRRVHAVFVHWETIVRNLTDDRIIFIDARRLSLDQLYEAISVNCCLDQDEMLRPSGDVPDELAYEENKYRRILEFITETGILQDIGHDAKQCARLSRRLQRDLGKICKYMKNRS